MKEKIINNCGSILIDYSEEGVVIDLTKYKGKDKIKKRIKVSGVGYPSS